MAIFNSWDLQDKTSELCLQSTNIPADTAAILAELKPLQTPQMIRTWMENYYLCYVTNDLNALSNCHAQNKLSLFNPIGFYLVIAVRCNTKCVPFHFVSHQ